MKRRKMSRDAKRFMALQNLSSIPVTPVPRGVGSLKEFTEQYNREQEEAKARAKAEQERAFQQVLSQVNETHIALRNAKRSAVTVVKDEELIGMTTQVPDVLPAGTTEDGIRKAVGEAFETLRQELETRGITLQTSAVARMIECARTQNINIMEVRNVRAMFSYLEGIQFFTDEDVTYPPVPAPVAEPVAETKQSLDDLLATTSSETREGRALLESALYEEMTTEYRQVWQAFERSLAQNFNGFCLTESQRRAIYNTMLKRGLSLLNPAHYDSVRVSLSKAYNLPLYPMEKLTQEMEDADLSDRNVRIYFAQRTREIQEQRNAAPIIHDHSTRN